MSRRKARETAFQMLFQMDVGKNDIVTAKNTLLNAGLKGGYKAFAMDLVNGVKENQYELREYLNKFTKGWNVDRLAAVDRNLLIMAMYEMKFADTPANIVINEAVEIAKAFGSDDSPNFVNAVLDSFYRKVMVENNSDYQVDEAEIAEYKKDVAAAKERAKLMAELEAENLAYEKAAKEAEAKAKAETKAKEFEAENSIIKNKGFRKIKKADITEKEEIKAEDILAYKKMVYGDKAFVSKKDLLDAMKHGDEISDELWEKVCKNTDSEV